MVAGKLGELSRASMYVEETFQTDNLENDLQFRNH